jgi:hypothetical protein
MRRKQHEWNRLELAALDASFDLDEAQMPLLQLGQIQGRGAALIR